jgi:hypothetical protein
VATALGNSANRNAFIKSFWWDKQRGMYTYLAAIIGAIIGNDNKNDKDDQQPTNPIILELEKPPCNQMEALKRWKIAWEDFKSKTSSFCVEN